MTTKEKIQNKKQVKKLTNTKNNSNSNTPNDSTLHSKQHNKKEKCPITSLDSSIFDAEGDSDDNVVYSSCEDAKLKKSNNTKKCKSVDKKPKAKKAVISDSEPDIVVCMEKVHVLQ